MKRASINWRLNNQIRASEVRVIGDDGKQLGVMKISDALNKARDAGLDLVEIAPYAKPPVAKIVEIGKFRYQEEKKLKKQKKKTKAAELKEIRFTPFIAEADYQTRLARVREFLKDGHKVRAVVKFTGRQLGSKKFGYELLSKLNRDLGENIVVDMEPKFIGRNLMMVISPTKMIKNSEPKEDVEENKSKAK